MKFTVPSVLTLALLALLALPLSAHAESKKLDEVRILERCKKACPTAKSDVEAYACTETLEHAKNSKQFKKTDCYKAHEQYESIQAEIHPDPDVR